MLQLREAGTRPFACTHRTHVAGTVSKLVHTKQILVHFYVVAGTVCKSSANDVALKIEIILSLLHDARIQTSWFHATCCRDKILPGKFCPHTITFSLETGMSRKENCRCNMSPYTPTRQILIHFYVVVDQYDSLQEQCTHCIADKILPGKFCPHNIIFSFETGMSHKENCRCAQHVPAELMYWQETHNKKHITRNKMCDQSATSVAWLSVNDLASLDPVRKS